jgi:hypothetical protein
MSSGFSDPETHVPDVTPGDEWDDAASAGSEAHAGLAVLPRRRSVTDKDNFSTEASSTEAPERVQRVAKEGGLRIEPRVSRSVETGEPGVLKVQEITGEVIRLEQEVPGPPKVERLTKFHEREARDEDEERVGRVSREWGEARPHARRWIFIMGGTVSVLIAGTFLAVTSINEPPERANPAAAPALESPESVENTPMFRLFMKDAEAARIYREFARAGKPEDVLPLIKDPDGLRDVVVENWHPLAVPADWQPGARAKWMTEEVDGQPHGIYTGNLPDGSPFAAWFSLEKDRLLLDWKATTAYGTARFSELATGTGDTREIRGRLLPGRYYTAAWPEADYQSYLLASPDGKESVWCYAPRESAVQSAIIHRVTGGEIIRDTLAFVCVTIHLARGPEGSLPNQWQIQDVLRFHWISP